MWRTMSLLSCLLLLSLGLAQAQEEITGTVKEERSTVPDEPNRQGLQMVKRGLTLGPLAIRYQQLIDPQGDKPLNQRYGDYLLGCEFPRYTWNWDLQYFLDVTITRPGDKPFSATRAALQKGIYVLEQGQRGVADMVWPLPSATGRPPAELVVRLLKPAGDPNWLYVRVTVEGDPEAQITRLTLGSYPVTTTGPPERQRWLTTLTRALQLTNQHQPFTPADEWAVALHNRMAHEDGGALIVMDPEQVQRATAGGTYGVEVRLDCKPTQTLQVAMGYFWDTPYEKGIEGFRQQAPELLRRLRALNWEVPLDVAGWQRDRADIEELLNLTEAGRTKYAAEWGTLSAAADEALKLAAGDSAAARKLVLLMRQARDLKSRLYEPALEALVAQATR